MKRRCAAAAALRNAQFRKQIVRPRKGKGSFKRHDKHRRQHHG